MWRFGLLLILAGCGGGVLVASGDFVDPVASERARGAFPDPAPVEVRGAPPDGAAPEAVAAVLRLPAHVGGGGARLSDTIGEGRRFVVSFDGGTPQASCLPAPHGGIAGRGAYVTLCVDATPVSGAGLRALNGQGPGDPRFEEEMAFLMREAMPALRASFRRSLGGGSD